LRTSAAFGAQTRVLLAALAAGACVLTFAAPSLAASFSLFGSKPQAKAAPQLGGDWDRTVGKRRLGAPYQADGVWYVPADQPDYDATGVAVRTSRLDGRTTAAGEAMDADAFVGAHATLPLPSMVDVTNTQTGRTVRVRLNDRGATKPGQIIELSDAAAQALGVTAAGAPVRVRYVKPAPLDRKAASPTEVAAAAPAVPAGRISPRLAAMAPVSYPAQPAPTAPVTAPQAGYGVQVGAFANASNAERAAVKLAAAGPAVIRPVDRDGQRLYRVVIGQWEDQASAAARLQQIQNLGFDAARVVSF
jgi:rare lipoprotein A